MKERTGIKMPVFNRDKFRKVMLGSKDKQGIGKLGIIYLLLICIGFVYLYPLLYMISRSFMPIDDLLDTSVNWLPSKFYLTNYVNAAKSMNFWKTFVQSVIIAGIPTLLNVVMCSIIGYGFARYDFKGKKIMMAILIFSFILPPQVTMMPNYVWYSDLKILNSLKAFIFPAFLGQGLKSQIFILIFYQFFKQVPQALIEASKIDGAGHFKAFVKIAIPSAAPAILVVFLFSIVWYWNESYLTQLYVCGAVSKSDWTTLVVSLKNFADTYSAQASVSGNSMLSLNESIKMAGTMLSILPLLIMYFILQRQFVESVDRTGITGE
ncbi:carbohydrate ABC transporter permease [Anaeromicropila populeti]|uniref:Multiple sugar transport system permease protein n=1 Tax=Anaeromicropila populeti TaxID=37658 RepID=A0A1I6LP60_9FIRM|nr:carbohydrate ABC transporter permease [Anaeromicropila populeti]SFS05198.1 multiple sugar transport system permease protein [Anaeromicropila populeti]